MYKYNKNAKAKGETGIFNLCNKKTNPAWEWKKASFKYENDNNNNDMYFIIVEPEDWINHYKNQTKDNDIGN